MVIGGISSFLHFQQVRKQSVCCLAGMVHCGLSRYNILLVFDKSQLIFFTSFVESFPPTLSFSFSQSSIDLLAWYLSHLSNSSDGLFLFLFCEIYRVTIGKLLISKVVSLGFRSDFFVPTPQISIHIKDFYVKNWRNSWDPLFQFFIPRNPN